MEKIRGGGITRHNNICAPWIAMMREAGLGPKREPVGYMEGAHRPDFVGDDPSRPGKKIALDVTVVHSLTKAARRSLQPHQDPEAGVKAAAVKKQVHYRKHGLQGDMRLVALAYDTTGFEGNPTRKFFKQVVQYYLETQLPPGCRAAAIPWYRSKFAQRWRVRIHQALQAGNSQIKRFHLQHWSGAPTPWSEFRPSTSAAN